MSILRSQKLQLQNKYLYLIGFGLLVMVGIQVGTIDSDTFKIDLRHTILLFYYYLTWILLIRNINGSLLYLDNLRDKPLKKLSSFTLSVSLLIIFHVFISNFFYYATVWTFFGRDQLALGELLVIWKNLVISRFLTLIFILGILKVIDTYRKMNQKTLRLASIESQLHQSRLETLKAQINPHFLFNTLHSISSLIGYDNDKARNMTIKMSELLRRNLEARNVVMHPLNEEMDYLQSYLEIQQERFHDRLSVQTAISETAGAVEVPSLILQPLIENAFTHGIGKLEGAGNLTIAAKTNDDQLIVQMTNTIPANHQDYESTGIGLSNVSDRLVEIYGPEASLETSEGASEFEVTLRIPTAR